MGYALPRKTSGNSLVSQRTFEKTTSPISQSIKDYLDAVRQMTDARSSEIVSVLIFGSATNGGFSGVVSDVDLMLVLSDGVTPDIRDEIRDELADLERKHGLCECPQGKLEHLYTICDQKIGGLKSLTICYRRDLLSGNPAAVFGVPAVVEWVFMSTHIFCFASIFKSAQLLWGEDLSAHIPIPTLTKEHLTKDVITHLLRNTCAFGGYLFLPNGTKYSMAILKGFIQNCFLVYTTRSAPLGEIITFFREKIGEREVFEQLLSLRKAYRPSPGFIFSCFRVLFRLYTVTLRENSFPATVETDLVMPNR